MVDTNLNTTIEISEVCKYKIFYEDSPDPFQEYLTTYYQKFGYMQELNAWLISELYLFTIATERGPIPSTTGT